MTNTILWSPKDYNNLLTKFTKYLASKNIFNSRPKNDTLTFNTSQIKFQIGS